MQSKPLPDGKIVKKQLRKAFNSVKKVFTKKSRDIARRNKRTGILAGSVGGKIKDYRAVVFAVLGVRDVKKPYGNGKQEWTKNIFHLVEFGTHRSRAKPFVTSAMSTQELEQLTEKETAAELKKIL